jgi:hypothetical protein
MMTTQARTEGGTTVVMVTMAAGYADCAGRGEYGEKMVFIAMTVNDKL